MRGDEGETDVKGRGYTGAAHKQPPTTHPQGGAPAEQPPTPATAAGVAHPHLALGPLPPELPPLLMQCTPGHLPGCPSPPPPRHTHLALQLLHLTPLAVNLRRGQRAR